MSFCLVMVLGAGILCNEPRDTTRTIDTACQAYGPIRWSVRDTDETIAQVRQHNAVYDELCLENGLEPERAGSR